VVFASAVCLSESYEVDLQASEALLCREKIEVIQHEKVFETDQRPACVDDLLTPKICARYVFFIWKFSSV
jgi:hypothetical protein